MPIINAAPAEIKNFFISLYGTEPAISQVKKNTLYSLKGAEVSVLLDPYGGCHVEVGQIAKDRVSLVQKTIEQLAKELKKTKTCDSIWLNFPLPTNPSIMGSVIPFSFGIGQIGKGDLIYDLQQKKLRVWQWLNPDKECAIPPGATHNMGATALVCDTVAKKALLVVNITRDDSWNLPGGHYDPILDKNLIDTALRETEDESGAKIDRRKVKEYRLIGQMQFPQNQFAPAINQIWMIAIDGQSQIKLNPPAHEIKKAVWIDYDAILTSQGKLDGLSLGEEIKASLVAAIHGLGAQEIQNKGWMIIHAPKP